MGKKGTAKHKSISTQRGEFFAHLEEDMQDQQQGYFLQNNSNSTSSAGGYVFISYSTKHQQFADAFRALLKKKGINNWMAPFDIAPGKDYAEVIESAISNSSCCLLLLTEAAQNSPWVQKEISRAISYNKTIIPVQLESVRLNSQFSFYLANCQVKAIKEIDEGTKEIRDIIQALYALVSSRQEDAKKRQQEELAAQKTIQAEKDKLNFEIANIYADIEELFSKRTYCEHILTNLAQAEPQDKGDALKNEAEKENIELEIVSINEEITRLQTLLNSRSALRDDFDKADYNVDRTHSIQYNQFGYNNTRDLPKIHSRESSVGIIFILDCSGSMYGIKIEAVQKALYSSLRSIRNFVVHSNADDAMYRDPLFYNVIQFGTDCKWMGNEDVPIHKYDVIQDITLNASGMTNLGLALSTIAKKFLMAKEHHEKYFYFLISDGAPTDNYIESMDRLRTMVNATVQEAYFYAIGIGQETDVSVLEYFTQGKNRILTIGDVTPSSMTNEIKTFIENKVINSIDAKEWIKEGASVIHVTFGPGKIDKVYTDYFNVRFNDDEYGLKKFAKKNANQLFKKDSEKR